jgi:colanic acid/amylovoran biosynthesis glycosyltransferase
LFPAGSLDELATAIEDCLSRSEEDIQRMGEAGYLRVIERHSVDIEAAKLGALFRSSIAAA